MLTSTERLWFESGLDLTDQLQDAGIKLLKPKAFVSNEFTTLILGDFKPSGIRIMILLADDRDIEAVASSAAAEQMTSAGWAWIVVPSVTTATLDMHGWLCLALHLRSEGMEAFARAVADYTKLHFDFTPPLCLDRNGTSKFGTSCAESLNYCDSTAINWHNPSQTNAQACPVTCSQCPNTKPTASDAALLPYAAALHDAVMLFAHAATQVLNDGGDLHDGHSIMAEAVLRMKFEGVGSMVGLDSHGDRIE